MEVVRAVHQLFGLVCSLSRVEGLPINHSAKLNYITAPSLRLYLCVCLSVPVCSYLVDGRTCVDCSVIVTGQLRVSHMDWTADGVEQVDGCADIK